MAAVDPASKRPRVFISYSQDSAVHCDRVRNLAERLAGDGLDVRLDEWTTQPAGGWTTWMTAELKAADFVLCVVTARYLRSWEKTQPNGVGRGAATEAHYIRVLYQRGELKTARFTPILFEGESKDDIPLELADYNSYDADASYKQLLLHLYGQASADRPEVGPVPDFVRQKQAGFEGAQYALADLLTSGRETPPKAMSPATELIARYGVVPFAHREEDLKKLDAWADDGARASVLLVHGVGGVGKTRLATEWVKQRPEGWDAGFYSPRSGEPERLLEALGRAEKPVALVVDYAASEPWLPSLLEKLAALRELRGPSLRLLLLARNAGDWWAALSSRNELTGLLESEAPHELGAIVHAAPEAQQEEMHRAARAFAERRGIEPPESIALPTDTTRDRALYLHMAALDAVLVMNGEAEKTGGVRDRILAHEESFWKRRLKPEQHDAVLPVFRYALAGTTLLGGVNTPRRLHAFLPAETASGPAASAVRLAIEVYQRGSRVPALEPDPLGEHLIHSVLKTYPGKDNLLDTWIRAAATDEERTQAFVVLGRIEIDQGETGWLEAALETDQDRALLPAVKAAVELAGRSANATLGPHLARLVKERGDVVLAEEVLALLPPFHETVCLRELGYEASGLLAHASQDINGELRAFLIGTHANWASSLGHREAALDAITEAVQTYRELAQAHPDAFLPYLAMSLNNFGGMQSALGQREAALEATAEAVEIYRRLAQNRPGAFLPHLAMSLNNLGNRQHELGEREAALDATAESVETYRKLAQACPDAFLPNLAASLSNLGAMQSELGQREAALDATAESVEIRRRLAQDRPDAFLPDLAGSLNNLGLMQNEVGQREAALDATAEAVQTYRRLAQDRPDAFLPDLAASLNNLGNIRSALGQREAALEATSEALQTYRKLAQDRSDAFLPDLAMSLNNLGARQRELGQWKAALEATSEALQTYRKLAQDRPNAFLPDLAMSLNNLGARQRELGQREAALDATAEAVEIRRRLAQDRPDAFLPDLARSLNNLGEIRSALGQREAALDATAEAIEIHRKLAQDRPDAFLPDLAASLNNLGNIRSALGQREAALGAAAEAVEIRRELALGRPDAFLPDLAASLNNLGNRQRELGQLEAALAATTEAVETYRKLARDRPDAFLPDLARSLGAHGSALRAGGDTEAAGRAFKEGLERLWPLYERTPTAFAGLAGALLGSCLDIYGAKPRPGWLAEYVDRHTELEGHEEE